MSAERDKLLQRYHVLVNKKFACGLTDAEKIEMEDLGKKIDATFDAFYGRVEKKIKKAMEG